MTDRLNGSDKKLYSIGDVSEVCNVSRRTLRYYDKLGLIKPDEVKESGYRYYSHETMLRIPIIKYFKMMNFELTDIQLLLDGLHYSEIVQHFETRLDETVTEEQILAERKIIIADWIRLVEEASTVIQTQMEAVTVKYLERKEYLSMPYSFSHDYSQAIINLPFTAFVEENNNTITGPVMLYFPEFAQKETYLGSQDHLDVVVLQEAIRPIPEEIRFTRNGGMFVSAYHVGSHETLQYTYQKILDWAQANRYELGSSSVERYVTDYWTTMDHARFVTEVLIPVRGSRKS